MLQSKRKDIAWLSSVSAAEEALRKFYEVCAQESWKDLRHPENKEACYRFAEQDSRLIKIYGSYSFETISSLRGVTLLGK